MRKLSIFWIVLLALAVTSAIPVILIAFLEVGSTRDTVEKEAQAKFIDRTRAEAAIVDGELAQFRLTTDVLTTQVQKLLTRQVGTVISDAEVARRMGNYTYSGADDLFGRDAWFDEVYFPAAQDGLMSNVFLEEGRPMTPDMEYIIAVTEDLDPLFAALADAMDRTTHLGNHNMFVVTNQGIMRQFPYKDNSFTPTGVFTDIPEYVAAGPEENPNREAIWSLLQLETEPDAYIWIAHIMPLYDGDTYLGVVVHDLDLATLRQNITELEVGKDGLAFVVDGDGYLVLHPEYDPVGKWEGMEATELASFDAAMASNDLDLIDEWYVQNFDIDAREFYQGLDVDSLLENEQGTLNYRQDGEEFFLAYQLIPETDWYLVLMQPRSELVQTASTISSRIQRAALIMGVLVALASVFLARGIARPILRLVRTAQDVETSVHEGQMQAISKNLAQLDGGNPVGEIDKLSKVFKQMVTALQTHMIELDSIYAMGQTITATIDYEGTLQALLAAMQQVVGFDAAEIVVKRGNGLVVDAWAGSDTYKNTSGHQYALDEALIGKAMQQKDLLFMADVPHAAGFAMETNEHQVRSLLVVPLTAEDKVIGGMVMVHHTAGFFTEDVQRQLKKLSGQAAIALANALKVRERESALKKQIEELKVEIDQNKRQAQVAEISDSDFFRNLQSNAASLRQRAAQRTKKTSSSADKESPAPDEP